MIAAHTLIWAAGVRANPLADVLGVTTTAGGRIEVGRDLRIPGHPEAFAVGDIAQIEGRKGPLPQVAQVAMQSGRHAAREIRRARAGPPVAAVPLPRQGDDGHHRPPGGGGRAARAGIHLQGTLGWFAWLGLHLVYLVGLPQPAVGVPQLGLELPHLGPRSAAHPRADRRGRRRRRAVRRDELLAG